jgi:hypothetical protein
MENCGKLIAHSSISTHLATSSNDSCKFLPLSKVMRPASSIVFDSTSNANFKIMEDLCFMESNLHPAKAWVEAKTARSMSTLRESGSWAIALPVDGSSTTFESCPSVGSDDPFMKFASVTICFQSLIYQLNQITVYQQYKDAVE